MLVKDFIAKKLYEYPSLFKDVNYELSKLKNNMGVFLENTLYQNIIENAENTDKQTGLYNNLYLY